MALRWDEVEVGWQEAKAGMPTVGKINVTPVEETKPHVVVEEPPAYANKMVRRRWGNAVATSLRRQRGVGIG